MALLNGGPLAHGADAWVARASDQLTDAQSLRNRLVFARFGNALLAVKDAPDFHRIWARPRAGAPGATARAGAGLPARPARRSGPRGRALRAGRGRVAGDAGGAFARDVADLYPGGVERKQTQLSGRRAR